MEDITNIMDDVEIVKEFLAESSDHLDNVESKILALEETPDDTDIINSIFRPIHSMKGSAGFLGMKDIGKVSHELETLLDEARNCNIKVTSEVVEILYEGIDILKKLRELVSKKADNKDIATDVIDYQPLISKISGVLQHNQKKVETGLKPVSTQDDAESIPPASRKLGEILLESGAISEEQLQIALQEQERPLGKILVEKGMTTLERVENALKVQSATGKKTAETVKVDTQKLDNLVNLMGELVKIGRA